MVLLVNNCFGIDALVVREQGRGWVSEALWLQLPAWHEGLHRGDLTAPL